jgi:hypothetical protein
MSRSSVRRLFRIALIVLVGQYVLVGIVSIYASEPWPAIVLPAFKDAYATDQSFTVEKARIEVAFEDSVSSTVPASQLLGPLPRSHHPSFLSAQCRPASLSGSTQTESCRTSGGRKWFVNRAHTLFPNRSVTRVNVVWERLQFNPEAKQRSATSLDTLHLSLPER